jgi:hypothetical protein
MDDEVSTQNQVLLRLITENLRDSREDLRSMRSFAAATFAIPVAVLVNDAGRSTLSIVLSVLTFAAGAVVLMPTKIRMITSPAEVHAALHDSADATTDAVLQRLLVGEIRQIDEAARECNRRRLVWVLELLLATGVLLTFVVGRL